MTPAETTARDERLATYDRERREIFRCDEQRPPEGTFGRVFRLDRVLPPLGGAARREEFADGVIGPGGQAIAVIRSTGVPMASGYGVEGLLQELADPKVRVVFKTNEGEL